MTSTSAYFAACADATQPLIRTVFFLVSVTVVAMVYSARCSGTATDSLAMSTYRLTYCGGLPFGTQGKQVEPAPDANSNLNALCHSIRQISQLLRLPPVQPRGYRE